MEVLRTIRLLVWGLCLPAVSAAGVTNRTMLPKPASTPWERAERARDVLEAVPEGSRTRADYTRALDAFRAVYHEAPRDQHAPASIFAVAELLLAQAHRLGDARSSEAAAGQYRFLRTQYPTSSLIPAALLAEAQVEQHELGAPREARDRYVLLVRTYPHSEQAIAARVALASLADATPTGPRPQSAHAAGAERLSSTPGTLIAHSAPEAGAARHSALPAMPTTAELPSPARDTVPATAQPRTDLPVATPLGQRNALSSSSAAPLSPQTSTRHHAALLTGIRHWSTPDYTRVAIDLGEDVTYQASRVPDPDRLLFDIHGTRLSPELIGKSFAITDGGFLKRIRAAQATPETARVVLDVSNVSEYSAFLLPNPSRLIIDIHGGAKSSITRQTAGSAPPVEAARISPASSPSALSTTEEVHRPSPAPRVAQTQHPTSSVPVPNTVATVNPTSTVEVSSLNLQPGRVEATGKPTSLPIAAVVTDHLADVGSTGSSSATPPAPLVGSTRKRAKTSGGLDPVAIPARPAIPTAAGETSLVRALGLKINRIVIDAGHGGHDSGTLGAGGIQEKDVVLDVALRLGKLLHDRLGAEIIYTRSDDTFIPLETRTAIANKAQADLFLSIHANSSPDPTARGVETYYLNFTQSADALDVAARENAVSGQSIHQLSDLVKKIALKDKIEESREFASNVEQALYTGLASGNEGLKNRGVKKAPFVVLIGANMPSILAEISFVTNERDADQLRRPDYRQRVAESLFQGVRTYQSGLGDSRTALERASRE